MNNSLLIIGPAYSGKSKIARSHLDSKLPATIIGLGKLGQGISKQRHLELNKNNSTKWNIIENKQFINYDQNTNNPDIDLTTTLDKLSTQILLVESLDQWLVQQIISLLPLDALSWQTSNLNKLQEVSILEIINKLSSIKAELLLTLKKTVENNQQLIVVSAEIGASSSSRLWHQQIIRSQLGLLNQQVAEIFDKVAITNAGIETIIK